MRSLVVVLIFAACGGKTGSGDCADAVGHSQSISESKIPPGQDPKMTERTKAMIAAASKAMIESCTSDKWSVEVIGCLKSASTQDDLVKCQKLLTPEQSAAVTKAVTAALSLIKP